MGPSLKDMQHAMICYENPFTDTGHFSCFKMANCHVVEINQGF